MRGVVPRAGLQRIVSCVYFLMCGLRVVCKGVDTGKRPGRKPLFTAQKKRCVAECAMGMARRGEEVTVEAVQARTPRASRNPNMGEVFDKALILKVFRTMCHDGDPTDTWDLYSSSHKTALEPRLLPLRLAWARRMLKWPSVRPSVKS